MRCHMKELSLDKNILEPIHFLSTDEEAMDQLDRSNDQDVLCLLEQLQEDIILIEDELEFDFHMKQKERLIDPSIWLDGQFIKASTISKKVQLLNSNASLRARKGIYLRKISK